MRAGVEATEADLIPDAPESDRTGSDRVCERCGASLAGRRPDARYCSDACRNGARRQARRIERDHARPVSAGLAELAEIVREVEADARFGDPAAIEEAVQANLAAVMQAPTTASLKAHLTLIEASYQRAVSEARIRAEADVAELEAKVMGLTAERDELAAEVDELAKEVDELRDELARSAGLDAVLAQLRSMQAATEAAEVAQLKAQLAEAGKERDAAREAAAVLDGLATDVAAVRELVTTREAR